MKYFSKTVALSLLTLFAVACGESKKSHDIIAPKPVKEKPKSVQKIGDYAQTFSINWVGSSYKVEVQRTADTALPIVTDAAENKYYDNKISIRILRKDGSEFFSRTFTKTDFASRVEAKYLKKNALLGIVYDKCEGDNVYFAGSVGSPDNTSDDYIPLLLKISKMGTVSISRDTALDTETEDAPSAPENELPEDEGV